LPLPMSLLEAIPRRPREGRLLSRPLRRPAAAFSARAAAGTRRGSQARAVRHCGTRGGSLRRGALDTRQFNESNDSPTRGARARLSTRSGPARGPRSEGPPPRAPPSAAWAAWAAWSRRPVRKRPDRRARARGRWQSRRGAPGAARPHPPRSRATPASAATAVSAPTAASTVTAASAATAATAVSAASAAGGDSTRRGNGE